MKRIEQEFRPFVAEVKLSYDQGQTAGAAGRPIDDCPYRRQDRRAAWLQGWHAGQAQAERPEPPTEAERNSALPNLEALRERLNATTSCSVRFTGPDGWVLRGELWHYRRDGRALCRANIQEVGEARNDQPDRFACPVCEIALRPEGWQDEALAEIEEHRRTVREGDDG
jgi:ribosome modulation factor